MGECNHALPQTVRETIRAYELLALEDSILVAVSGGADSVCLVHGDIHNVVRESDIVDAHNAWVREATRNSGLIKEPLDNDFVLHKLRQKRFECYFFIQRVVMDLVNTTHASLADEVLYYVALPDNLTASNLLGRFCFGFAGFSDIETDADEWGSASFAGTDAWLVD